MDEVRRLQEAFGRVTTNWSIETEYHFGGFARRPAELDRFIEEFAARHGIVLDWVYEAKMLYGVYASAEEMPAIVSAMSHLATLAEVAVHEAEGPLSFCDTQAEFEVNLGLVLDGLEARRTAP